LSAPIVTRLATDADRAALIAFIRDHWSANHVFVHAPDVFDWQYAQADGRINMVMAEQGGSILGVLGFIPLGRFDPALGDNDILLALWKVREDVGPPGLGLRLLKFIQAQLKPRMIGAIGISAMVGPIYAALGYTLDRLHHAALFNPDMQGNFRIAANVPDVLPTQTGKTPLHRIRRLTETDRAAVERIAQAAAPQKSAAYVWERYINHPFYNYTCTLIERETDAIAVCIWREVACKGAKIFRIVDIVGDTAWLAEAHSLLMPFMASAHAEYMDVMQVGTPEEVLRQGGWISPEWQADLILPNYFAPFEARNIDIKLAYRQFGGAKSIVRLYRADSDQDRPNQAPVPSRVAS
jgi:hypothetical protein